VNDLQLWRTTGSAVGSLVGRDVLEMRRVWLRIKIGGRVRGPSAAQNGGAARHGDRRHREDMPHGVWG